MAAAPAYYIGDVHGMASLLEPLLGWIEDDARSRGREPTAAFLGDLVDRGPDSRGVIDLAIRAAEDWPGTVLHLGNHDDWFLEMIETDGNMADADSWIIHGGIATIQSYLGDAWSEDAMTEIGLRHPGHVAFLKQARHWSANGPFLVAHAGFDPTLPPEGQPEKTLMWIRDSFLGYVDPEFGPVVHGHTIVGRLPHVTENRFSLDTGAYETGMLTCMAVDPEAGDVRFVQSCEVRGIVPVEPVLVDRGHGTALDRLPDLFSAPRAGERRLPPPLAPPAFRRGR